MLACILLDQRTTTLGDRVGQTRPQQKGNRGPISRSISCDGSMFSPALRQGLEMMLSQVWFQARWEYASWRGRVIVARAARYRQERAQLGRLGGRLDPALFFGVLTTQWSARSD